MHLAIERLVGGGGKDGMYQLVRFGNGNKTLFLKVHEHDHFTKKFNVYLKRISKMIVS